MPKLSKEQIKRIADTASMFSSVNLKCDGYTISLQERLYKRKLRVVLFVNGHLKGGWIIDPELHFKNQYASCHGSEVREGQYVTTLFIEDNQEVKDAHVAAVRAWDTVLRQREEKGIPNEH